MLSNFILIRFRVGLTFCLILTLLNSQFTRFAHAESSSAAAAGQLVATKHDEMPSSYEVQSATFTIWDLLSFQLQSDQESQIASVIFSLNGAALDDGNAVTTPPFAPSKFDPQNPGYLTRVLGNTGLQTLSAQVTLLDGSSQLISAQFTVTDDADNDGVNDAADGCANSDTSVEPVDTNGCGQSQIQFKWVDSFGQWSEGSLLDGQTLYPTALVDYLYVDVGEIASVYHAKYYYRAEGGSDVLIDDSWAAPYPIRLGDDNGQFNVADLSAGNYEFIAEVVWRFGGSTRVLANVVIPTPQDGDQDGVLDYLDSCLSSPAGMEVDEAGCADGEMILVTSAALGDWQNGTALDGAQLIKGDASRLHTFVSGPDDYNLTSVDHYLNDPNRQGEPYYSQSAYPHFIKPAPWDFEPGNYNFTSVIHWRKGGNTIINTDFSVVISESDDDGDGVANQYDLCPATPANVTVEFNGCHYVEVAGSADADELTGGAGQDKLIGGDGNDTLKGGDGNDWLVGGAGDDVLDGGNGHDIYYYALGDGNDVIKNYQGDVPPSERNDVLLFAPGITPEDVVVWNEMYKLDELFIKLPDGAVIHVKSHFIWNNNHALTAIEFADGTRWDQEGIIQAMQRYSSGDDVINGLQTLTGSRDDILRGGDGDDTLNGLNGNDTLYGDQGNDQLKGGDGNDQIYGGAGDDVLDGGNGHDIYYYALGDGNDVIKNYQGDVPPSERNDVLLFAPGITPEDVVVWNEMYKLDELFIKLPDGAVIHVKSHFIWNNNHALTAIEFADGTRWDQEGIIQAMQRYSSGDDVINGLQTLTGSRDDILRGGDGDDTLNGLNGNDTLYGDQGNDQLKGGDGNDQIYGGAGDDVLDGGNGHDIYVYALGDGNDVIKNYQGDVPPSERNDVLLFAPGITPEDVVVWNEMYKLDELFIKLPDGAVIHVKSHFIWNNNHALTAIEFADGTRWDQEGIIQAMQRYSAGDDVINGLQTLTGSRDDILRGGDGDDTLNGLNGNDTLYGDSGNDWLAGGAGDDKLIGGEGFDVYYYQLGDGNDVIVNGEGGTLDADRNDMLVFGTGILPSEVAVRVSGNDLYFTVIDGSEITLAYHFHKEPSADEPNGISYPNTLAAVQFSDGTEWRGEAIIEAMYRYTDGDDQIAGLETASGIVRNEILRGGAGNDTIDGNNGNDTLYGDEGDDFLEGGTGDDTLYGGVGADIVLGGDDSDILFGGVDNDLLEGGKGIDQLFGQEGNDTLKGDDGSDELTGGLGDDVLNGGKGHDVFHYNIGDGNDLIYSYEIGTLDADRNDVLKFGVGISPQDVKVWNEGNHLYFTIVSGGEIKVDHQFHREVNSEEPKGFSRMHALTAVQFSDGTEWRGEGIVEAMYRYTDSDDNIVGLATVWDVRHEIIRGGSGNDTIDGKNGNDTIYGDEGDDSLSGSEGNDILVAGPGNDTVHGSTGDDIYIFALGDGINLVKALDWRINNADRNDSIQFEAGILPADVTLERSGYELVITHVSGLQVTVERHFLREPSDAEPDGYRHNYAIQFIRFNDGTQWDYDTIAQIIDGTEPATDSDGDGVPDEHDHFPNDPAETSDIDGDGIGDNADTDRDGDGVLNDDDAFPYDATESSDLDADGIGDNSDDDRDGDGVPNSNDAFPSDASEWSDLDSDGVGDNADQCPNTTTGAEVDARGCEIGDSIEAEDFNIASPVAPFVENEDGSRTIMLWPDNGAIERDAADDAAGQLYYPIVASASTLTFFITADLPNQDDESFYYKLEGSDTAWSEQLEVLTTGYQEIEVASWSGLIVGRAYTLKIQRREDGAKFDSLRVVGAVFGNNAQNDADHDGIIDSEDACLGTQIGGVVNAQGCSAAQLDDDGDGVTNDQDGCLNTPAGEPVNGTGCAASERDSDQDGIVDSEDQCAATPIGRAVDSVGCETGESAFIEAEGYNTDSPVAPFELVQDDTRSVMVWPGEEGMHSVATDDAEGQLFYTVIASATTLHFYATVNFVDQGDESFFYKLDGFDAAWQQQFGVVTEGYEELAIASWNGVTVGQAYTLKIQRREDGAKFDALRVTGGYFGTVAEPSPDRDGDGIPNEQDAFPDNASEWADLDGDGTGDNSDTDIDGDGVANESDAFPRDSSESSDIDGDGIGDNTDADRDNDGVDNALDLFPNDPAESTDMDGDGIGDNGDPDRDGDGVANDSDAYPNDPDRSKLPIVTIDSPKTLVTVGYSPVTVTGTVDVNAVAFTVNGVPVTNDNGTWQADVALNEGHNTIVARMVDPDGIASTASIHVSLDLTPPYMTIESHQHGQVVYTPTIAVTGLINDIVRGTIEDEQVEVTVNDLPASIKNRSYLATDIPLVEGDNEISVIGIDQAGNAAVNSITVKYVVPEGRYLEVASGQNQTGTTYEDLASPLVVKVLDDTGAPVADKNVVFRVTQGSGGVKGLLDDPVNRAVLAKTNAQGLAQTYFQLGQRSGIGNHKVTAKVVGYETQVTFHATAEGKVGNKLSINSGNNQRGGTFQPLPSPFVVAVTDLGANVVSGSRVKFEVRQGGGLFENGETEITAVTDSDGRASAHLTLGGLEGIDRQVVRATLIDAPPVDINNPEGEVVEVTAGFTATAFTPKAPGLTSISGVIMNNQDQPLPGVTIRVDGTTRQAVSDEEGQFKITEAPVGPVHLVADGSTTTAEGEYPALAYNIVTVSGVDNPLSAPIYMVKLNTDNAVLAGPEDVELTLPEVPGFKLEIPADSVTFPDGSREGLVSVTVVNSSKVPMAPPNGMQPQFIVTIQPAGAMFDPPARLSLPNVDGHEPGAQVEMFSFDHDLEEFVAIGLGTVNESGTVITTNPGVGVIKAGWHCGAQPGGSGTAADCGDCHECDGNTCQVIKGKKKPTQTEGNCMIEYCDKSEPGEDRPDDECLKCDNGKIVPDPDKEDPDTKDPHDCWKYMCDGDKEEAPEETLPDILQEPKDCAVNTCDPDEPVRADDDPADDLDFHDCKEPACGDKPFEHIFELAKDQTPSPQGDQKGDCQKPECKGFDPIAVEFVADDDPKPDENMHDCKKPGCKDKEHITLLAKEQVPVGANANVNDCARAECFGDANGDNAKVEYVFDGSEKPEDIPGDCTRPICTQVSAGPDDDPFMVGRAQYEYDGFDYEGEDDPPPEACKDTYKVCTKLPNAGPFSSVQGTVDDKEEFVDAGKSPWAGPNKGSRCFECDGEGNEIDLLRDKGKYSDWTNTGNLGSQTDVGEKLFKEKAEGWQTKINGFLSKMKRFKLDVSVGPLKLIQSPTFVKSCCSESTGLLETGMLKSQHEAKIGVKAILNYVPIPRIQKRLGFSRLPYGELQIEIDLDVKGGPFIEGALSVKGERELDECKNDSCLTLEASGTVDFGLTAELIGLTGVSSAGFFLPDIEEMLFLKGKLQIKTGVGGLGVKAGCGQGLSFAEPTFRGLIGEATFVITYSNGQHWANVPGLQVTCFKDFKSECETKILTATPKK